MKFVLYRILSNDLSPWGTKDQTKKNLQFILDNEENLEGCEKVFVLNRIIDKEKENRLFTEIAKYGYSVMMFPFDESMYKRLEEQDRLHYLTNVNYARNECITSGFGGNEFNDTEYVLPLDGSSFFRKGCWGDFDITVALNRIDDYFLLGQWRASNYEEVLNEASNTTLKAEFEINEQKIIGTNEFQIVFGKNAKLRYNESMSYGECDRADLLWRLGIPGVWDRYDPRKRAEILSMDKFILQSLKMASTKAV